LKQFGANPKGINVFDANGRFFLMTIAYTAALFTAARRLRATR
jgi:hypothetical protein